MLDWILIFSGIICLLVGLAGSVVPMLPGPPLSYAAMLLLHFTDRVQFTASQLLWWLAVVVVLTVLDYVVPMLGSKYIGGSRWGTWGCLVGTLLGLFFLPWGIIVGPFLGAFLAELIGGQSTDLALRSGIGSLLGFLFGTVLKCIACGYFCWQFVAALV